MFGRRDLIRGFQRNLFLSRTCMRRGAAISAELTALEKKYKIDLKRAPSLFAYEMSHRKVIERLLIGNLFLATFNAKIFLKKMSITMMLCLIWVQLFQPTFLQFQSSSQRRIQSSPSSSES